MREDVREMKRDIILHTAASVFYEKGYQNATVDDIAAAMSVSKAVVYYNFSSKLDVLEYIVDRVTTLTLEAINEVKVEDTPPQKLAELCFQNAQRILTNQTMIGVFFREERYFSPNLRRRVNAREKIFLKTMVGILDEGVASGDFHVTDTVLTAFNISGMILMAFSWYQKTRQSSRRHICQYFAEQALRLAGYNGAFPLDVGALKLADDRS